MVQGEPNIALVNIDGRIYRKQTNIKKTELKTAKKYKVDEEDAEELQSSDASGLNIERDQTTSTFVLKIQIPQAFYKFIIGKKSATKNKIQQETGATINIPKDAKDETVIIKGQTEQSVVSAKTRIDIVMDSALQLLPHTHFLSVPLDDPSLSRNVGRFYVDLEQFKNSKGFDKSILIPEAQLHLTLGMLKLYSEDAMSKAVDLLKQCAPKIYDLCDTRSLVARLSGLEIMNDDPSSVDVLYIKVQDDAEHRLKKICDFVTQTFTEANLIATENRQDVKLHVTVVNTKLRTREKTEEKSEEEPERIPIDATDILKKLGSFDFGQIRLSGIHISDRSAFEPNGYWKSIASINLP